MSIRLGVVMDPIDSIKIWKDSTFAMLLEAEKRSYDIHYMEMSDLYLLNHTPRARTRRLHVEDNPQNWFTFGIEEELELGGLDVILMRKDPPFNMEYIYATYILELAQNSGVLVVNRPQSLRDANEKVFTSHFPQCTVPALVSRDMKRFRKFLQEHKDIIVKPLDGMGGASIFRVRANDPNQKVIFETLTDNGRRQALAQVFIPEISAGDKRILLIDGEPVEYALARIPEEGETRGNLAAGGAAKGIPLTDRDFWLCNQIAPVLKQKGLMFVGIDVIGDYLTEINVTSPTCIRELDALFGLNISARLMDAIELRLGQKK